MMTTARRVIPLAFLLTIGSINALAAYDDDDIAPPCNLPADPARIQYVIAYDSRMQAAWRERTAPHAGVAEPVTVSGYQRGWYTRSKGTRLGATYLGVVPDAASSLNAVMYRMDAVDLAATDRRERLYCRVHILPAAIKLLAPGKTTITNAQLWIYEIPAGEATAADEDHPIAQSYVDVFLAGCLEQEERYKLRDFAVQCVRTTTGWSAHWVNDRLYPGHPSMFQPRALQIDRLLAAEVPSYWVQTRSVQSYWSRLPLKGGKPGITH
ncbi:MAG TPA: gamma-glutamylcyclotransferase family protein [Burkholderiales bacterium]|nr:gamma-glutamylcyclotransferase family protein [Burkholderiales bacterium]